MIDKNRNEFADIYAAVGKEISWKNPFFESGIFLVNSENQKLMGLRSRWFANEQIHWKEFSGEIEWGLNSFAVKGAGGRVLASVKDVLHPPVAVTVGSQGLTCDRVWNKWWNPDLVLKDDGGEIIKCSYRSRKFQLLRAVDGLPAVVAMFWLIFRLDQS
jgi:hypothetical protein